MRIAVVLRTEVELLRNPGRQPEGRIVQTIAQRLRLAALNALIPDLVFMAARREGRDFNRDVRPVGGVSKQA